MGDISAAVETAAISLDDLAQRVKSAFEKVKEGFIKKEGKDALAELADDPAIYKFLVNPANYPHYPQIIENAILTYINFIFDLSVNEAAKKAPPELMKKGILHIFETHNLSKITNPDAYLGNYLIVMRRCLGDYLDKEVYENKDERTITTLRRGS